MQLFGRSKPLFGMIHLLPLPGAPRFRSLDAVIERAIRDADVLLNAGVDGLVVENYGDAPFCAGHVARETIAAMTAVACELRRMGEFPLGINVLRSDGETALIVAMAARAQFIRVNVLAGAMLTDQGLITGCAASLLRLRANLRAEVGIWADVLVKHAQPLVPIDPVDAARDLRERALADALIVTGPRTGLAAGAQSLVRLRAALRTAPLIVGSGITPDNIAEYWEPADGFIVGSSLRRGSRPEGPVEEERVRRMVAAHKKLSAAASRTRG